MNGSPRNRDKSNNTILFIESCLKFQFPQEHCRKFLKNNVDTNTALLVRTWGAEIKTI